MQLVRGISAAIRRVSLPLDILVTGNLPTELKNRRRQRAGEPRILRPRPLHVSRRPRAEEPRFSPWSYRRINALLRGMPQPGRYLEVGVERGLTLESIRARSRWGVDPAPNFDLSKLPTNVQFFRGTSDEFFHRLQDDVYFDVVFLDGLHLFEQTYKDLRNALAHVPEGAVLIDDTVPSDEVSAIPDRRISFALRAELGLEGQPWHGDVWKVVVYISKNHPELDFRTIIGSGNPQTLLWRRGPGVDLAPVTTGAMREVCTLSYADTFANGLPALFRPCCETEALAACLAGVARFKDGDDTLP
jgi:hypothetical protein